MSTVETDKRPLWTPRAFIANGVNCPTSAIRQELQRLRQKKGVEWLLLLVYQDEPYDLERREGTLHLTMRPRFFQSLAILAHISRELSSSSENESIVNRLQPGWLGPISEGIVNDDTARLLLSECWWQTLTKGGTRAIRAEWITDRTPTLEQLTTTTRACLLSSAASNGIVGKCCLPITTLRSMPSGRRRGAVCSVIDYGPILEMILCSVPVTVNQQLGRIRAAELITASYEAEFGVDKLVTASTSSADYDEYVKQFARSILTAALQLTGSSTGNIYLSTPSARELDLAAEVNNSRAIKRMQLNQQRSVVGFVFDNGKPLLINDLSDFRRTHPDVSYKWVGALEGKEPYAELAVPIVNPNSESKKRHSIGVLNVEKVRPDDCGRFGENDVDLLRFLALRFCIWRKNLAAALANRSLSQIAVSTSIGSTRPGSNTQGTKVDPRIPKDYQTVHGELVEVLGQAYFLARSKTATIRLVSTDGSHLIRFCAFPHAAMSDPFEAIRFSRRDSVNAFVARTGNACDLRDVRDRSAYLGYGGKLDFLKVRQDIRSEYCLPLSVRGRLVGTLNLESEFVDAYSGERHFLQAVRSQIELSLYTAQTRHEQTVLSASARVSLNTHELLKCAGELQRLANSAPADIAATLLILQARIRACTVPTRPRPTASESGDSSLSYKEVFERLAIAKNIDRLLAWGDWHTIGTAQQDPRTVDTLSLVISEVLDNSFLQATKVPGGMIRVSMQPERVGGSAFDIIHISHPVLDRLDSIVTSGIYRVPISKPDRPHIGAFLAGAMMRSIGGDITFWYNRRSQSVHTAIHIPDKRSEGDQNELI